MHDRRLVTLTPEQACAQWETLRRVLNVEAYCAGELDSADLLQLVADGRACILVLADGPVVHCAAAVEILNYPRRRVLNAIMVGGRHLDELYREFVRLRLHDVLEVDAIRGMVRPSVARLLRRMAPKARDLYTVTEIPLC